MSQYHWGLIIGTIFGIGLTSAVLTVYLELKHHREFMKKLD